jgi:hypothetical protein
MAPARTETKYSVKDEERLIAAIHEPAIKDDLLAFVKFIYPWGKPGTPLEHYHGPRIWQAEDLREITAHLHAQQTVREARGVPAMFRKATASGRGSGKSAEVAWLAHWMMSTRLGSTTIVTANTEMQLKSRTFAELTKWVTLALNAHWFDLTVLSMRPAPWFERAIKDALQIDTGYYYCQGQLWSEENPDAFAGVHNPLGVAVIFDEASGIPAPIFSVTEGFFTEPVVDRYWLIYSNPRRNSGGFYDCFHTHQAHWRLRHLDARTVEGTDPKIYAGLIDKHGIESDVVRVEVLGQFPNQGAHQFITSSAVQQAQARVLEPDPGAPLLMGVDVARFGLAATVVRFRQGRDARSIPPVVLKQRDNMAVVEELAHLITRYRPELVAIDIGQASGVIDRLRELGYKVHEVWFGKAASQPEYANVRTEIWARLRDWLGGGCLDHDPRLFGDLTAPEYHFYGKAQDALMLESKESMEDRGLPSPDHGDALALTFAFPAARRDLPASARRRVRQAADVDYALFDDGGRR